jgi:transposase
MISIGCDIGKNDLVVFLEGKHYSFKNGREGIEKFILRCKNQEISRVVLEPTGGYERKLLKALHFHGIPVSVVHPRYVRNFAGSEKDLAKTDKIDAKVLAEYGEVKKPRLYEPKEAYRFDLEELINRRDNLVSTQKEEKQRLEKEPSQLIFESINNHLKYLEAEIKVIESGISRLIEENAKETDGILRSEKGIGAQTSDILIGLLPELGRIDNRKIAKLVGVAPMAKDSGTMSGKRAVRGGRSRVRMAMYMASVSAVKSNPKVKDFYNRLRAQGKPPKSALLAVMRKLIVILNSKMRLFYEGKNYF